MSSPLTRFVNIRVYTLIFLVIVPLTVLHIFNLINGDHVVTARCLLLPGKKGFKTFGNSTHAPSVAFPERRRNKTILFWTKMFDSKNFYFGDGDIFADCPVSSCFATSDRNYQPVEKFDAVMFHAIDMNPKDLPETRSEHQRYIFAMLETIVYNHLPEYAVFHDFFNWTMTFRRDSDIMWPYGTIRSTLFNDTIPPHIPIQWKSVSNGMVSERARNAFAGKTKMAAWFVSRCQTASRRENLVKALQKHMDVDVYGMCGPLKCSRANEDECYALLDEHYFFYMSLENSLCRDYVSEKMYIPLMHDVIPVVYGIPEYDSYLPPGSYIAASDFATAKDLASFLLELSKDEERYLSYFKWKSFYMVEKHWRYVICELCKGLHEDRPRQTYENVYQWWVGGADCRAAPSSF